MIRERLEQELRDNKQLRTYVRMLADCSGKRYPIVMVDGDLSPKKFGRRGVRLHGRGAGSYPQNVFQWHIYGYYARSSQHIEVGSDWLMEVLLTRNYLKVKHGEENKEV